MWVGERLSVEQYRIQIAFETNVKEAIWIFVIFKIVKAQNLKIVKAQNLR